MALTASDRRLVTELNALLGWPVFTIRFKRRVDESNPEPLTIMDLRSE